MSELPPHLRALLDLARQGATATPDDLQRVRAKLQERLVLEPVPFALLSWLRASLPTLGVVAAAATAVGLWQLRPAPHEPQQCPPGAPQVVACPPPVAQPPLSCPVQATAPAAAQGPPVRAVATPVVAPPVVAPVRERVFAPPSAPTDPWSLELGLLQDAQGALADKRPMDALHHVENHLQLFPETVFREERSALHVLALCMLNRGELATEPLEELLALAPASTYLFRIQASCPDLLPGRSSR